MAWTDQFNEDAVKVDLETPEELADRVQLLSRHLATVHALGLRTTNYHWNVVGPLFMMLHAFFGEQYAELVAATDTVAEHLRTYGARAPATYVEFADLNELSGAVGDVDYGNTTALIADLLAGHATCVQQLSALGRVAEAAQDDALIDLVGERTRAHRKTMWMLRSYLETERGE